jgi:hypothetical protein
VQPPHNSILSFSSRNDPGSFMVVNWNKTSLTTT